MQKLLMGFRFTCTKDSRLFNSSIMDRKTLSCHFAIIKTINGYSTIDASRSKFILKIKPEFSENIL